ncbi:NAD(P)-binding protein [Xylariaceae sp. FL1272]|nr:NAD(P)-binding protein [Xylariaceae sp. FL1272]
MAHKFDLTPEQQASQLHFLKSQVIETKAPLLKPRDADLSGQTAIVTGGNVGVGLELGRQLLALGVAKLILAVRNEASGQEAVTTLLASRKDGPQSVEVWKLDLLDYASVTAFAERAGQLDKRPDIVILNAGLLSAKAGLNSSTGHDIDMQVNFLSTVLLLVLLLPIVKSRPSGATAVKSPVPHISVVTSVMAHWAKLEERNSVPLLPAFDSEDPARFDMEDRYSASKLFALMFLAELARRIPSDIVILNAPTPGMTRGSGFMRQTAGTVLGFLINMYYRVFGHTCDVGASQVMAAGVKAGPESHGQFVENGKVRPLPVIMYTAEGDKVAKQLWKETLQELSFASVEQIIKDLGTSSESCDE